MLDKKDLMQLYFLVVDIDFVVENYTVDMSELYVQSLLKKHSVQKTKLPRLILKNIVINLGTDFDLERGDKIVLYDDNETCDIQRVEKVNSSFTLFEEEEEEEPVYFYSNTVPTYQQNINTSPIPNIEKKVENINIDNKQDIPKVCDNDTVLSLDKTYCIKIPENAHKIENSDTDVWLCDSGYTEVSNTCVLDGNNEKTINTTNTQQFSGNIEKYITQKEDSFWWKTLQQFKNFFKKLKFW